MQTEIEMPDANIDEIFDALLDDLDVQWRKVRQMADYHPDRPREILHLDDMRETLNLLRRAMSTTNRGSYRLDSRHPSQRERFRVASRPSKHRCRG